MDTLNLVLTLVGAFVMGLLGYRGGAWLAGRRQPDAKAGEDDGAEEAARDDE